MSEVNVLWCYYDQVEREAVCGVFSWKGTLRDAKQEVSRMVGDRAYPGTLMIKYISRHAVEEEYIEEDY